MLAAFFGATQRKPKAAPSRPAKVVDLQSVPGLQQGAPIPWMTAEEYLRLKDQREGNGNAS